MESLLACEDSAAGFLESGDDLATTVRTPATPLPITSEPVPKGKRAGPYTIQELLGSGGMGQVYKAYDNRLERHVAVKFLAHAITGDSAAQQRFQREARAASALNHPNICTVHDVGDFQGRSFIVMELLEGQPLKERIAGKPIPFPEFVSVCRQVSAALIAAHAKGIVHRDVKPGNIFVTPSGQVKIFDFGLARRGAGIEGAALQPGSASNLPLIRTGTITGTVAYMSPEQALGEEVDARSDIFSLGVVLYEMATGRPPFRGKTVAGILGSILTEAPAKPSELNPAVPARVDRLILKALEKDREDRYQSIASLAADLDEGQGSEATAARLPRSWRVWTAATAAVLLAFAGVLWNYRSAASWDARFANARFSRLTNFEGAEGEAALSADGKFVAFLSDRDGPVDIWISQVGSGQFTNLSKGRFPGLAFYWDLDLRPLAFTPDGTNVSLSWIGKSPDTWLLPVMGGIPRPFLQPGFEAMWSADGAKLVYHSVARGDPTFVAEANGNNPKQVFVDASGAHCHYPIWSPDGRFIYYTRGFPTADELDIWRVAATGGDPERITHHNARITYPTLLDNRTLVYSATSEDGPGVVLYAMDVEKRRPRVIMTGVQEYSSVSASANGRRLVVTESKPNGSLWTVPLSDGVQEQVAASRVELPTGRAVSPRFGPDYLLYLSSTSGADGLWKFKNGSAAELWKPSGGGLIAPPAISPDGS
ncbi:MAG: serine/threonine-protein kinase [Bryobacterales bacterium]|nr:serine/threonine-protein kinase [Bryobacterales bacterium]